MYKLGRLLSKITDVTTIIGGLAIALMMVHITLDIVCRFVFNTPIPGTITIVSNFYMVIAAFVPLAFAEQKEAHISVEVLTERMPAFIQKHLAGWCLLVSGIVFALLTVRNWQEAVVKHRIGASIVQGDTSIVIWPTYYVLPIGFGLMTVVLLYKFVAYLTGARSGLDDERATPTATAD